MNHQLAAVKKQQQEEQQQYWEHVTAGNKLKVIKALWTRKKKPLLILKSVDFDKIKFFLHSRRTVGQLLSRLNISSREFYNFWRTEGDEAVSQFLNKALSSSNKPFVLKGQAPNNRDESWIWAITSLQHRTIPYKKMFSEIKRHAPLDWSVEKAETGLQKVFIVSCNKKFRIEDKLFEKVISILSGDNTTKRAIKVTPMIKLIPEAAFIIAPEFFRVKRYPDWSEKVGESIAKSIQIINLMKEALKRSFEEELVFSQMKQIALKELKKLRISETKILKEIEKAIIREIGYEKYRGNFFVVSQSFARVGSCPEKYLIGRLVNKRLRYKLCTAATKMILNCNSN